MFLLCRGTSYGGHGCGYDLPVTFRENHKEKSFLVWEIILLHYLEETKETVVDGATSGILYIFLPKVIIIVRGLESYIA